jgi:hypothetical protein
MDIWDTRGPWNLFRQPGAARARLMYDMAMRWMVAFGLVLLPLSAQEKQANREMPNPTNLKVLKVATGAEVNQIMRTFTPALGVQCVYCHIQGNFASDENPKKEIARTMIRLSQEINAKIGEGKLRVTCYTCHRGEAEPKTAPEPTAGRGQ